MVPVNLNSIYFNLNPAGQVVAGCGGELMEIV